MLRIVRPSACKTGHCLPEPIPLTLVRIQIFEESHLFSDGERESGLIQLGGAWEGVTAFHELCGCRKDILCVMSHQGSDGGIQE
jgi:hypothetical protein